MLLEDMDVYKFHEMGVRDRLSGKEYNPPRKGLAKHLYTDGYKDPYEVHHLPLTKLEID